MPVSLTDAAVLAVVAALVAVAIRSVLRSRGSCGSCPSSGSCAAAHGGAGCPAASATIEDARRRAEASVRPAPGARGGAPRGRDGCRCGGSS